MEYQVGDQVVHLTYGPGKITAIEEKSLGGETQTYYVVETGHMTLWVQTNSVGEKNIRRPTGQREFRRLLHSLNEPGVCMPDRHQDRKNLLIERMNRRSLGEICSVIRDLNYRSHEHNLNDNDRSVLQRAEDYLVAEWEVSLGTPRSKAVQELHHILGESQTGEIRTNSSL